MLVERILSVEITGAVTASRKLYHPSGTGGIDLAPGPRAQSQHIQKASSS